MTLLKQAGTLNPIDIAADVAEILAKLDSSRLNELADFLAAGDRTQALTTALGAAGLQRMTDTLAPLLKARNWPARNYLNGLLAPVSAIPEEGVVWSGNAAPNGTLPVTGSLTLAVSATAGASLSVKPGPLYSLTGEASVAGSLSLPFTYGSFSSSAKASMKVSLDARFRHAPATRVVDAFETDLPVLAELNQPDKLRRSDISEVVLRASGQVKLGASVSAGKSFTTSIDNGGKVVGIEAGAALEYGLEWARSGDYTLTIKPAARDNWLAISLADSAAGEMTRSLSIGANIRVTGLEETVAPLMKQLSRYPDAVEAFASKYAQPSTLLANLLKSEIPADDPVIGKLVDGLFGNTPADALAQQLQDAIVNTVKARSARWTALLDGEVDSLTGYVLNDLSLPVTLDDEVAALISRALSAVSSQLQAKIKDEFTSLLKEVGAAIEPIIQDLQSDRQALADGLDGSADRLLKPALALVANYRLIAERIGDAIEAAEKQGLGIRFAREVRSGKQESSLLSFELDASNCSAQALFRGMLIGDFVAAVRACQDNERYIELHGGRYKTVTSYERTVGVTINILGKQLANTKFISSRIPIETTPDGAIVIADVEGALGASVKAGQVDQRIRFSSGINLMAGADADEAAITLSLTHGDADMTAGEMGDFFGLLNAGELVSADITQRLAASHGSLGVRDAKGHRALSFLATLTLTRNDVDDIIKFIDRPGNADRVRDMAIHRQLEAVKNTRVLGRAISYADSFVHFETRKREFFLEPPSVIGGAHVHSENDLPPEDRTYSIIARSTIEKIGKNANRLVDFVELWKELVKTELVTEQGKVKDAQVKALEKANRKMLDKLDGWVEVPGALPLRLGEEIISPFAIGFFGTLLDLLQIVRGSDTRDQLLPIVSWKDGGRTQRIAVI